MKKLEWLKHFKFGKVKLIITNTLVGVCPIALFMAEKEKQALRNLFAWKKVSEMTPEERKLFDKEF